MSLTRIEALTQPRSRQHRSPSHPAEERRALYRGSLAGPVHRRGPTWHDPALLTVSDPAKHLMAPAVAFHDRVTRMLRAAVLLVASASMTPALPFVLGLA